MQPSSHTIDTKIRVTKLQAARQQLRTAVRLWFTSDEPVSVHTLVFAAYEVLHSLAKRHGVNDLLFDSRLIKPERRKDYINSLKSDANFFKHAREDPDPDKEIEFLLFDNEMFILYSVKAVTGMSQPLNMEERAFIKWFSLTRPELLTEEGIKQVPSDEFEVAQKLTRNEFFEAFLSALG